jgi:phenol hydroxylase P3 protein
LEYLGSTEHRRWQDWHPNDRHSAPANPVDPDLLKTG